MKAQWLRAQTLELETLGLNPGYASETLRRFFNTTAP